MAKPKPPKITGPHGSDNLPAEGFVSDLPPADDTLKDYPGANPVGSVTYETVETKDLVTVPAEMAERLDAQLAGRKIAGATWRECGLSLVTYPDYKHLVVAL